MMNAATPIEINYESISAGATRAASVDGSSPSSDDSNKKKTTIFSSSKKIAIMVSAGVFVVISGGGIHVMSSSSSSSSKKIESDLVQVDFEIPGFHGIHCCQPNYFHSDTPGNDYNNCLTGKDRFGNHQPCSAKPEYVAAHPDDPCEMAGIGPRQFCCPLSNSNAHTAWVLGGCVKNGDAHN